MATGWPWWRRSSPLVGALGGLIVAASIHLLGRPPTGLLSTLPVETLFEVSPAIGYAVFLAVGALLGLAFRIVEDRLGLHQ